MTKPAHALAILLAAAGPAAADNSGVDVRANINGTCRIESIQPLDFGPLEQGPTAVDKSAGGAVRFWCTKGVEYTVTLGPGANPSGDARRMKDGASVESGELIRYELVTLSPAHGTGRGPQAPEVLELRGTVRAADYKAIPRGEFRDSVAITVTAPACCASLGTVELSALPRGDPARSR